ncbi:hypothetical protein CLF_110132 [Clonorchis sinensis]|uniref:Uncharacterized protein n=1 Tax=Clonorchis sinensis TaxID=79923 RepID=G7YKA5_CLOSI|nr:hypothetical protein CLF_110132 [Clonorchis sinensis]
MKKLDIRKRKLTLRKQMMLFYESPDDGGSISGGCERGFLFSEQKVKMFVAKFNLEESEYAQLSSNLSRKGDRLFENSNKLLYLLHYCCGGAKESIEQCVFLLGIASYKKAIDILRRQFGRPYDIAHRTIVQKVHEADAMLVLKREARSRMSRKPTKRIRRLLKKRPQLFFKKLTTGDTEDELAFRKMRNRCKSEIRQWNIRKQATILDLARKNRNVLFKYMRHRRRNKPSAFSLRDRNEEPTSDPIVVSEFYRDQYAGLYSVPASPSYPTLSRRTYERPLTDLVFTVEDIRQLLHKINPFCVLGPDEVHPRILKETSYTLATHFHLLFRQSLDEGHLHQLFFKKLTTGDTEDELAFRKMRNRCKSEIRQWNIRKQATILDLARKNRNVLFKYMRHRRRNKPSAFSLRDRNEEPTSDPIVVSEFYRDQYAGERQPLSDKNKTDQGNLGKSLDPAYQSVNP